MDEKSSPARAAGTAFWPAPHIERRSLAAGAGTLLLAVISAAAWLQSPRADPFQPVRTLSRDWWLHPVERNAFARLPALDVLLTAATGSAEGRKLWVAGDLGTLLF